jgi:hypothetical protein
MWQVHAFPRPNHHTPVPTYAAHRVVSRGAIRELLVRAAEEHREVAQAMHLASADLDYPSPFGGNAVPGLEAIGLWAVDAAAAFDALRLGQPDGNDTLRAIGNVAIAWYARGHLRGVAWHDDAVCVFPISGRAEEVEVEYRPEPSDLARTEELERLFQLPSAMFLDCRMYLGSESIVTDLRMALDTMGTAGRMGVAKLREPMATGSHIAGAGVGKVFRWLGELPVTPKHDKTWLPRLKAMTAVSGANSTFDLRTTGLKSRNAVVVVHGTTSCGVINCLDLKLKTSTLAAVHRYEHDTFLEIEENAEELASLLSRPSPCEEVLVIAHSRGGLVARRAAQLMRPRPRKSKTKRSFRIWTYGTPHQGTPLVSGISRFGGLAVLIGTMRIDGVPRPDRVTAAFSYLLGPLKQLPPGIACMAPGHTVLRQISNNVDPYPVRAHAAHFDGHGRGFSVGLIKSWFNETPNDTIVSVESALAAGTSPFTLRHSCCHSEYFRQESVQQTINQYLKRRYDRRRE